MGSLSLAALVIGYPMGPWGGDSVASATARLDFAMEFRRLVQ
jgi:hypothetical protein